MAIYIFQNATGVLVSWCPGDADPVAPQSELEERGVTAVKGLPALDETHIWSQGQRTVISIPRPFTDAHGEAARANWKRQVEKRVAKAKRAGDVVGAVQLLLQGAR
jgi:hypothetical protein